MMQTYPVDSQGCREGNHHWDGHYWHCYHQLGERFNSNMFKVMLSQKNLSFVCLHARSGGVQVRIELVSMKPSIFVGTGWCQVSARNRGYHAVVKCFFNAMGVVLLQKKINLDIILTIGMMCFLNSIE